MGADESFSTGCYPFHVQIGAGEAGYLGDITNYTPIVYKHTIADMGVVNPWYSERGRVETVTLL